ncbi:MAG: VWA domain-containing protein [Lachnospiraceae bacterium]|nr:VWA domain-containing protein [Lachnospiraceae bacterium]
MKINPIIPVWLMAVICVCFLLLKRKGRFNFIRQSVIVVLLFVINLRPMVESGEIPSVTQNVDVLFVVDNTISMLAEDYDGDGRRIDAVKEDCMYIANELPAANYSVITIGNEAVKAIPYTNDINMLEQVVYSLNGQSKMYARGTSLNSVIDVMAEDLDNERENYQIVFFISDGEMNSKENLASFDRLEEYIEDGAVLGYGTEAGGPMQVVSFPGDDTPPEYIYEDYYYKNKALSKIDEKNLNKIASDMGIEYIHMTKQSLINDKLSDIKSDVNELGYENGTKKGYKDIYYFFVIPLVLLLIFDFVYYRRKVRL